MPTPTSFLKVEGKHIVHADQPDKPVLLRGAGLGGWMNQENFITGYPGHEYQVREGLEAVLGKEKADFYWDKFLEYFFTEEDAKFFASLGLNAIRLPINYRHFEDDMNPRVLKKDGFKHLDRVIDLCAKHGIYTVIDLHALPGGHDIDWHADSGNGQANFFRHKDFQDRAIWLWEELAKHYKDNKWIAGYNPMNEPTDELHTRVIAWYERVEKAIRAIDPNHILFWDGNTFGADFSHFPKPFSNSVYACHDYTNYGFAQAPEIYTGAQHQREKLQRSFDRKVEYMRSQSMPIWNGEFGPTYQNAEDGIPNWEEMNEARFKVLNDQLEIYDQAEASWSIWLYKDIGFQGMTYVGEETPYIKLLKPFLLKKKSVACDAWGVHVPKDVEDIFRPMEEWIERNVPSIKTRYPKTWGGAARHLGRAVRETLLSEEMVAEYCEYFRGKSTEELDELAKSFAFENCKQRERLNEVLRAHGPK